MICVQISSGSGGQGELARGGAGLGCEAGSPVLRGEFMRLSIVAGEHGMLMELSEMLRRSGVAKYVVAVV